MKQVGSERYRAEFAEHEEDFEADDGIRELLTLPKGFSLDQVNFHVHPAGLRVIITAETDMHGGELRVALLRGTPLSIIS